MTDYEKNQQYIQSGSPLCGWGLEDYDPYEGLTKEERDSFYEELTDKDYNSSADELIEPDTDVYCTDCTEWDGLYTYLMDKCNLPPDLCGDCYFCSPEDGYPFRIRHSYIENKRKNL